MQPFDWILDSTVSSTAIVGICKNAGKTTLLNHLLHAFPQLEYGVFSTGIDGEERDTVFQTPKPRVNLGAGQIFCCDTATLDGHGSSITVLEKLAWGNALRPLWLAKTSTPVQTEITGPAAVQQQVQTLRRMQARGAQKILIDGSLDRKSIALSDAVDAVVVVIGASFGSIASITCEIKRLCLLNQIPHARSSAPDTAEYLLLRDSTELMLRSKGVWLATGIASLIGTESELRTLVKLNPEALYIPGVLTDEILARTKEHLKKLGIPILLRHPDCLKLSLPRLEKFLQDFNPEVLIPFKIRDYALNTLSVGTSSHNADDFRARLHREFPRLDLPDIREMSI